jgi:poly(beta-D-mannuronate) lyase
MKTPRAAALSLALVLGGAAPAVAAPTGRTVPVATTAALTAAVGAARAGDRIVLTGGPYVLANTLRIQASGTAAAPIVIAAATGRKPELRGPASLEVDGSYVTVSGLTVHTGDTVEVKAGAAHAHLTGNTFQLTAAAQDWLTVAGNDAEVDHNVFSGKRTAGVFLQISGPGTSGMAQRVRVDHNYFADHSFSGANGGEALRLGVSARQHAAAYAVIEDNLFERVNGDQEAISVKASYNTIRHNTVRDSTGTITLRHGAHNVVDGNFLIGGTTGIRVFGNDQTVTNNVVEDSTRSRGIEIGSGDRRDDAGSTNDHEAADRVLVAFNTVVMRAGGSVGIDVGDDDEKVHPDTVTVADNIASSAKRSLELDRGTRISWVGNVASGSVSGVAGGFKAEDPKLARDPYGVYRPLAGSPVLGAALGTYASVTVDLDGQSRPTARRSVGADEPALARMADRRPATRALLGI